MCCKQLPLNYNDFHVFSATPCDMECNMKKLLGEAEIVEEIVTTRLNPLRRHRSEAQARVAVGNAIKMIRLVYWRPRPDAGSIRKAAENFKKKLEPLAGGMPIFLKGCGRTYMTLQEFRSALDWFESADGSSPKFDEPKKTAAIYAYCLVDEFSQKSPSTTFNGQVREIGLLLYEAVSGEKAELKRQTDAVCRNCRSDNRPAVVSHIAKIIAASARDPRRK